ncbi:MAG: DUF4738 domain-containing protein [Prevotella sp.]|nr:DUF4738 domain-containing protein [Prevotella sp.]
MRKGLYIIAMGLILAACQNSKSESVAPQPEEDLQAKQMLQGIWMDQDEDAPSFRAEGDSIFYPDTTSQPARFSIIGDTLYIAGAYTSKYPIVKQAEHIFQFKTQGGEVVHLVKSENADDIHYFDHCKPVALNQRQTIKRDTVVYVDNQRYHFYVQVNPTRQKVVKPTINEDGLEVENVYYDNSIRFILFNGAARIYQHDFHREDFKKLVPEDFLKQSVLSDLVYSRADSDGVRYIAQLAIPDSPSSYEVEVLVSYRGRMEMALVAGGDAR